MPPEATHRESRRSGRWRGRRPRRCPSACRRGRSGEHEALEPQRRKLGDEVERLALHPVAPTVQPARRGPRARRCRRRAARRSRGRPPRRTRVRSRTVPSAMRAAPAAASSSMRASDRTPPPASTDRPSMPQIARIRRARWPHGRARPPRTPPTKSTTCTQRAPASANECATATGSSERAVMRLRSPRSRRTTLPSMRSMAGTGSRGYLLRNG